MNAVLEVLTADGWTEVTFTDIEGVQVAAAPGPAGISLTLIGERDTAANQVETGILDVAPRHEALLKNPVPRLESGESVPVALQEQGPESADSSNTLDDT
ncbi:hypothetical protein [Haloarcula marismortui]|uniref:Uncharacterized protein n=1 Tax=Haloarcula marismortui ATCC 33799 TaxID=662475 RepID=M0KW51_9EURY|nr:hypothetical protein [Haloarcula californiae]EMA23955.1 hypothetical protein C435_03513 [Haloarcula californiae ATCC 33799]